MFLGQVHISCGVPNSGESRQLNVQHLDGGFFGILDMKVMVSLEKTSLRSQLLR